MELIYTGSVKNLYRDADGEHLWFEFTDDYSAFDWGKMPDPIAGKGEVLARLAEWFFSLIENPESWRKAGLADDPDIAPWLPIAHHFCERTKNRIKVKQVEIPTLTTRQIGGQLVYDYSFNSSPHQLLPLEVIFRFGVPAGSSLLSRKHWYPFEIFAGKEFDQPLIEFSTKFESEDRIVSYQEAALILKGDTRTLEAIYHKTTALARLLQKVFAAHELKLWDGKLEWALSEGTLTLVDSIGPDELRVGIGEATFDKQFLRNFYLDSPWGHALAEAKKLARERGLSDWKRITVEELRHEPLPLPPPYRAAAEALYQDFYTILVKEQASNRYSDALKQLAP